MPDSPLTVGYQTDSPASPPIPERSPLEPLGEYSRRIAKWRRDNAWRAGQLRAIEKLNEKQTQTLPEVLP